MWLSIVWKSRAWCDCLRQRLAEAGNSPAN